MWPANSPDLNLIDYAVWTVGALQQRVCCDDWLFETAEQLKQAIVDELCALSQKFINRSINEWRRRLKWHCVSDQNGRHIEHFWHFSNNLSVVGYTRHFCYSLCTFVNCTGIALLLFCASSTVTRVMFYVAQPTVVQWNRVKVTSDHLS